MCFVNEQEREEWEYQMGAASELQNAYRRSQMERNPDDTKKINEMVAAGKFVIVEEGTDYCPSTDAILGSRKFIASIHDTREAAEMVLNSMGEDDHNPDIDVYILPMKVEPRTPIVYDRDEIPF